MPDLIPAAPGWYVESKVLDILDPVIAWTPSSDLAGSPVLLPYVDGDIGHPPRLLDLTYFEKYEVSVSYRP